MPEPIDMAAIRADHARAEFCCWCSPDEACRVLALCDAAERWRLAWLSAGRDRSKIRHEMWAMQGERDQARAETQEHLKGNVMAALLAEAKNLRMALEMEREGVDLLAAERDRYQAAWTSARNRAIDAETQRDQARAAAEAFSAVVTDYMLGDVDGRAVSRAQTTLRAAIAGDEPPAADVAAIRAEARVDALLDAALDLEDGLLFHCQRAAAEWLRDRAETIRFRAAAIAVLCDRCGRPGREHEGDLFSCPGPPTHLPLSEVLELAADLAQRAATPPEAGHG